MEKLKTGNKNRKPAGYNKRTEEQRAYDIAYCSNLFLRGYTYREITEALNRICPTGALVTQLRFQWFITTYNKPLSNGSGNGWIISTITLHRNCAN